MLLPETIDPASPRLAALIRERPCWTAVVGGALQGGPVRTAEAREQLLARLATCELVVLRRRHERLWGPVAGLVRDGDDWMLLELAELDEDPDGDVRWFALGVAAVLHLVEHQHPGRTMRVPDGLPGSREGYRPPP